MFQPRAGARIRADALAVWLSIAGAFLLVISAGVAKNPAPTENLGLTAAEQRRADAIAEYATGVSEEIRGDLDSATDDYKRALQSDPHNTTLAVRLGQIYASRHDMTNAVSVLEYCVKANPNDADAVYWLGFVYRSDNQDDKAAAAFHQALKLDPTNLDALARVLDIYSLKDSASESAKALDHSFHQKSESSTYWTRLGDIYAAIYREKPTWSKKIERKRILQCYEKALALTPTDSDLQLRLADAYSDNDEFQKASDAYSQLLVRNPNAPLVRERLAANYLRADQKVKAAAVLEEIIKRDPLGYGIYNDLAELYADLGKIDRAISDYQQSLVIKPNQPENYAQITALQLDAKRTDDAVQTMVTWKAKFPTDFRVPYFTGLIQTDRKHYTEAAASFADAENLAQESPDEVKLSSKFYFSYAAACERAGDFDKAVSLFRRCLQIDPDDHTACNYLGYMWADKGVHLQEALTLIQKAVKLDPDNGAYIDSLGWALFKLGRNEEALVQLHRAVELLKDEADVYEHLADVLLKVGKPEEALTALRRASELEPDNKEISEKLQKLKSNQSAAH
jgi:tetratricopeptide (TPR) repeat protein